MPTNFSKYEQLHYKNLVRLEKQVEKLFAAADQELAYFVQATFGGNQNYTDSPLYKAKVETIQQSLHDELINLTIESVVYSDQLSAHKSQTTIQEITKARDELKIVFAKEYNTNIGDASKYFALRSDQGFNISDRVWDITAEKVSEMADAVKAAIDIGTSARDMAKQIQQYLKEPDKAFRRVRNADGELVESQARQDYHPGQGVYKQSKENALRLTRTETNTAYRLADSARWKQQEFVVAIDIKLSNSHGKVCDMCNYLVGRYPKDFVFPGWHISCLCYGTPVLLTPDQYDTYEDYLLGLKDKPVINYESEIPVRASDYISENAKRINGWKNTPYWVEQNSKYVSELL